MGVSSLNGIQMVERCELLAMPVKHHPDVSFVRGVSGSEFTKWNIDSGEV